MLLPDEANSLKLFDLAYENFQSISRAQRFYLSFLLVYLSVVWGWYLSRLKGVHCIHCSWGPIQ